MGFSLKKLLEGATAQVNPFDKGRTFSTVQRGVAPTPQPARTPPPQGRPQQSFGNRFRDVFDANTQSDIYRRTQKNQVPIFENPGNLLTKSQDVAGSIAKPLVRVPMATPLFARNVAAKIQGNAPLTGEQFYGKTVVNATGFTGSGRQALGDTATNAINIGIPGSGKLLSGGISKGITNVAPRVAPHIPKIIPKVIGTSGTGAVLGGPSNVASLIGEDTQPITRQNVGQAYKAGTVGGMAFGAAIPIAGVAGRGAVRAAPVVAKQTVKAAKAVPPAVRSVEDRVTMPRVNIEEQNILRDYSDYLAGAYKPQGKDLSDLIGQTRIVGQRHGVDLTNGSPDEQLARSTGILDQIGKQRDSVAQGGYARIPGGKLDPAPDLSTQQKTFINDYAEMMEGMDKSNGVSILPDGTRASSNSPFYRQTFAEKGRKPSKTDWFDESRTNIENGNAAFGASDDYKTLPKLASVEPSVKEIPNQPLPRMSKAEWDVLAANAPPGTKRTLKVAGSQPESNIPVRLVTRQGDRVTATNVNPNIKRGEKRFALGDNDELIPDTKGAYRIFTDDEGRVTNFRVGDKVFNAKDFGDLSDVNGYGSTLATMRRNIERGFGKETSAKVNAFLVDHQQAQATKLIERQLALKQGTKQIADDLGISFGVGRHKAKQVSAAIQDFGEGKIDRAQLDAKFGPEYAQKIVNADNWFRSQYDTLLDEMNETLVKHGYDPVPKRANYYTHFQEPGLWQSFGLKMQEIRNIASPTMQDAVPDAGRGKISNKLAGESEFTLPNKRFNPFALQRKGDTATSDAFQSFERYLTPTLNNIYMTPSITRARVLAKAVAQDADVVGKDANATLIQVKEWANNLAGKSSRLGDRQLADSMLGGKYLKAAQWAQKKAGQNTIVGNLSTAVMQPIVLSQTAGKFGFKNTILATIQEMSTAHAKDAPIRMSSFMKRRYNDLTPVTASKVDRAANIANTPLKVVEQTAARITWNAAHNDAIAKGLKGNRAIKYADVQAEKTLSGRSIGEKPEAFRSKAAGPITMYQLEVNNFIQQVGKEMTAAQAAKTMVAAYGLNLLLQEVTGRQVGFNPIDAAIDSYGEIQKEGKSAKDKAIAIGQRFAGEVVDNTPVIGPLANSTIGDKSLRKLLGSDSNIGRFGVSSPLSTLITNPQYAVMPFGGAQIKKTFQGAQSLAKGKLEDKKGKTMVNIHPNTANVARGLAFGNSAIPEVNQYYNNIGKKKVDQTLVQNQTDSRAENMGKPEEPAKPRAKAVDPKSAPDAEYKSALERYNKNKSEGKLTEPQDIKAQRELKKLEVGANYDKSLRDLYSLSKQQIADYVSKDPNGKTLAEQLIEYDNSLFDNKLTSYRKFTTSKGVVSIAPVSKKSSGGSKKGGKKGSSKKFTLPKITANYSTTQRSLSALLKLVQTSTPKTRRKR